MLDIRPHLGRQRRYLVGYQLLDLVKSCNGKGMGNLAVRRRGPDRERTRAPLDHGIFVLLLYPAVDDGIPVGELKFPDLTIPVDAPTLVQLALREGLGPIIRKDVEPVLQGMWRVDPFRTVGLHLPKRLNVDTCRPDLQQKFKDP